VLDGSIERALDEHLGARAEKSEPVMKQNLRSSWAVLPKAECKILWLRHDLPYEAEAIVLFGP
jgi:hypothetical protein